MKIFVSILLAALGLACSSLFPYKDQSLEYLQGIEQDPTAYAGRVVSFSGEVKAITEDTLRLRLVLKIAVPLYEQAVGKSPLSYDLLLVSFDKQNMPQMTGIKKGNALKILARVVNCETRKNLIGAEVRVLHVQAFALVDRTNRKDFVRPEVPSQPLYESWKSGKLFFKEQPVDIEKRYEVPTKITPPSPAVTSPTPAKQAPTQIVYDEEEPPFDVNAPLQR